MTQDEMRKLKKVMPLGRQGLRETTCPVCGETITEDDRPECLTYSKTRGGGHVFIHERCILPQGRKK